MTISVADLHPIELRRFVRADGTVVVLEAPIVPFAIARVFTVCAPEGAVRGCHAHRECTQLMLCPSGAIDVVCDDGVQLATFRLEGGKTALLVPPGIWAEITWRIPDAVLVVLCDRTFDEADYLRDRKAFLAWRRGIGNEVRP